MKVKKQLNKANLLLCLYAMFFLSACQSVQTVRSVDAEKKRTEAAIEIIDKSNLSEPEKKILKTEFQAKDKIIESQVSVISKAESKTEAAQAKVDKAKEETKGFAIEAGYGRVLKWMLFIGIAGVILFIAFKVAKKFAWL